MSLPRFEDLYERYCDGELSDVERGEFLRLLEDPAWRSRFARIATFEAAVSEELRLAAATQVDAKPSSRSLAKVPSRRITVQRPAPVDDSRVLRRIGLAAAAAILLILGIVFATSPKGGSMRPLVVRPKLESLPEPRASEPVPVPVAVPPSAAPESPRAPEKPAPLESDPKPAPRELPPTPPAFVARKPAASPPLKAEDPPLRESAVFIATFEQISGEVHLESESAEAAKGVRSGQSVTTGKGGYAALRFPDGSHLELAGETSLARLADGPAGKSAHLEQGMIFMDVVKQPAGRPLVLTTSHAESTVLGTQLVLAATPVFTRIDVREGRVKFTRLPQAVSSVIVNTGHYAIAGPGGDFAAKSGVGLWKAPPAGLQLWLRADAGVKLNGTTVASWADQSAAGNGAAQTTAGAQPTLVANALSGRPALRFDGIGSYFTLPDGFGDFRLGLTAFVVLRPAPGAAGSRFIDLDIGPACDNIVFGRKDTPDKLGFWVFANSQSKGKVEVPGAVVSDQLQSFSAMLTPGGHVTLFRNGAAIGAGDTSAPRSVVRKPNFLFKSTSGGADSMFKGDLFEILLYNRALSEAERGHVEAYLNAKYFDPSTPPLSLRLSDR